MDSNIREEFYEAPQAMNKTAIGAHVQTYHPITSNIVAQGGVNVVNGQVIFELNTGAGEYLDLFKSHLQLRYTSIQNAADNASFGDCPLSNMIARGQLYVNGKKVAASQNWTQDAILSKRITFSKAYNMSVNKLTYNRIAQPAPAVVVAQGPPVAVTVTLNHDAPFTAWPVASVGASTHTDDEYFDALFIRDESCIIPPNCNVRLLLDIDSNYPMKMALLNVANPPDNQLSVDSIRLIAYTIVKDGGHPKDYIMNLITLNSFLSTVGNEVAINRQYQVSSSIVKAAVTFLSTAYLTAANPKIFAGNILSYADDTTTNRLIGLDFKLNNIVIPNTRWDFNTNGFREAYLNYVNESGGVSDSAGKESFEEWQRYGMIHLANIVKPESDKSNSLQINAQFPTGHPAAAFLIVTSFEENAIKFSYDTTSGALIETQTLM